jgi:hypothetical protein
MDARFVLPLIEVARADAIVAVVSAPTTVRLAVWLPPGSLSLEMMMETISPVVTVIAAGGLLIWKMVFYSTHSLSLRMPLYADVLAIPRKTA